MLPFFGDVSVHSKRHVHVGCSDVTIIYGHDTISMLWGSMAYVCLQYEVENSKLVKKFIPVVCLKAIV